ncbi:MAG: SUMF1/EgtB/PvdO family nonheme iron enzyme [Accumulibacter sp.]|uniref:SUMF1/EgtB/PvdO family nonheme iron enzyme n=1 Tax=Accumulibacter sp. TaxID=2053492 RepID=UPI002FC37DCB
MVISVFGSCCVLPLFLDSVLCSLRPLSLRVLRLRRGCGGNFPRRAQRNARFFCYPSPTGWRHPVRQSGEVVRGGSWNNHRDNARCAYRNRNHPGNRNDNLGFRVVLRSSHVLPPLLLVPPPGGTARRHPRAGRVPEMPVDSRKRLGRPRRRKKNSARQVWSARRPQGGATAGQSPAPGT